MECSIAYKDYLRKEIQTLDSQIKQGFTFTNSGVHINTLKNKMINAYRSVSAGRDPSDSLTTIAERENNLLFTVLRSQLGELFNGGFGSKADRQYLLEDVKLSDDIFTVKVRPVIEGKASDKTYSYKFNKGSDRSYITRPRYNNEGEVIGGSSLYIPNISTALEKALNRTNSMVFGTNKEVFRKQGNIELRKMMAGIQLGSNKGKLDFRNSKKVEEYTHGDPDQMLRVARELDALDEGNAPKGYLSYAETLVKAMHPRFFREMDVYIKSAKTNVGGLVEIHNNRMLIAASKDKTKDKSNVEVYLHEVIHSMTAWALREENNPKANQIQRELNYVFKKAQEAISWKDYLKVPLEQATESDKLKAQNTYDYIFNSPHANDEFISHGLTHPRTMELLEKIELKNVENKDRTILQKLMGMYHTVLDIVMGNYDFSARNKNAKEQVHALAFRLAEINNTAEETKSSLNLWGRLSSYIDITDDKFRNAIQTFTDKHFDKHEKIVPPKNTGLWESTYFYGKLLFKSIYNPHYRNLLGIQLSAWNEAKIPLKPDGTVREFFGGFFTPDEYQRKAEFLGLERAHLDTIRESVVSQTKRTIIEAFKNRPDEQQSKALTRSILDTNLSTLMYSNTEATGKRVYDNKDIREVLTDADKRNYRIAQAEKKLKEHLKVLGQERRYNWVKAQAQGLGYFMATHQGNPALNTSSRNIVRGVLTNERFAIDANTLAFVDEIAALNAIKYTDNKHNEVTAQLMKDDWKGVSVLMDTYEAFKKDSESKLFKTDRAHMMDGYSKELFEPGIEIVYRRRDEKEELEKLGYEFKGLVNPKSGEKRSVPIGMFVSSSYGRVERLSGATNLGGYSARGTSLKEIKILEDETMSDSAFQRDMSLVSKEAAILRNKMFKGEKIDFESLDVGLSPIIDATGQVVDYRHMMSKKNKEELLKQNLDVVEVMGRTYASVIDKEARELHNSQVLKEIKNWMKEDWTPGSTLGKSLEEYTLIGPEATDPAMRELYYTLPKEMQEFINRRKDKTMAVPSKLMSLMFGYPHMKLSNSPLLKWTPKQVKAFIDTLEGFWIDLIKIVKGNILLKMPIVLLSNLISNAVYLMSTTDMGPIELINAHKDSWKDAKTYLDLFREKNRLTTEIGQNESKLKSNASNKEQVIEDLNKKKTKLARIVKEMESNSIHEIFEAGLFQTIIEDVHTDNLNENNKIKEGLDKFLDKSPLAIKKPLQWAYLSKETGWYKFNQEVLQLSDLVARDIKNKKMKAAERAIIEGKKLMPKELRDKLGIKENTPKKLDEKQTEEFLKVSKVARLNDLLDSFVNYNKPNGRFEEYLNRVGLLMFTKYLKRIQRVLGTMVTQNPVRSTLMLAAAVAFVDIDKVQDMSFLARGFDYTGDFSFANMLRVYNPVDNFMNAVTPAVIKPDLYMGLV